ncbi:hypothetical protein TDSAC_0435 [Thermodesulfobium acidiphilum]|uniref:Uncharacterized protein n=1 Tax=Thermodesulfobium acidiphilum TaxID=1794699 RepID=A0A2R4VZ33_THEAF|nr:DsrE family protein [Thermodesulfobium acidiphilum]AWB09811.1 hypothetical protein TDSAC_0435 [Thermodesulfobium acidiphilum]
MSEKLVITLSSGPENPEKAALAYVMANAALAMDAEVLMVLQSNGVYTVTKGVYEHIKAPGHDPIKKHVENFLSNGGKFYVCIPCCQERDISQDQILEGCEMAKSGKAMKAILEAKTTLNY